MRNPALFAAVGEIDWDKTYETDPTCAKYDEGPPPFVVKTLNPKPKPKPKPKPNPKPKPSCSLVSCRQLVFRSRWLRVGRPRDSLLGFERTRIQA